MTFNGFCRMPPLAGGNPYPVPDTCDGTVEVDADGLTFEETSVIPAGTTGRRTLWADDGTNHMNMSRGFMSKSGTGFGYSMPTVYLRNVFTAVFRNQSQSWSVNNINTLDSWWIQIDNLVTYQFTVQWSSSTGSKDGTGMEFVLPSHTPLYSENTGGPISFSLNALVLGMGYHYMALLALQGQSTADLYKYQPVSGGVAVITDADVGSSGSVRAQITFAAAI